MKDSEDLFYQIHLYSKGEIEIFQNVFYHFINVKSNWIIIKYSSAKNLGSFSVSERSIENMYNIKVLDEPEFIPEGERPLDKKITLHGAGKTIYYYPQEWISVETRLPVKEGKYQTNNGERYFKKDWIYNFDLMDKSVTHWKPH